MFSAVVTFGFLAIVGYALARTGVVTEVGLKALNGFVFYAVMPAAVFIALISPATSTVGFTPLAVFGVASILAMVAGFFAVRGTKMSRSDALMLGIASGYTNSGNIGIPVALHLFGNEEIAAAVLALQVTLLLPTVITLLGADGTAAGVADWVREVVRVVSHNPIIVACIAGLLVRQAQWSLPQAVQAPVEALAAAAVSAPLVTVGASLYGSFSGFRAVGASVAVTTAVKVVIQPAIVWCGLVVVLGMPSTQAAPWVVFAALPTAQIMGVLAIAHDRAPRAANVLVAVSTVVAGLVIPVLWWLLGGS